MRHSVTAKERTVPAASLENDALFAARAALKLAARQRKDADAQLDHIRRLVRRLERPEGGDEPDA
jgi:hypothetical protein